LKNILVVGAHYDDAELAAGGAMAKWVFEGKSVYKITLTDNETVSDALGLDIHGWAAKEDSRRASGVLGVTEAEFTPVRCCWLQYGTEIMQRLENVVQRLKIDTLLFHFHDDFNQDHIAAHEICKTAGRHCDNLLMYQSNNYIVPTPFYPTVFVDITDYADIKFKALAEYAPQHNRYGNMFDITKKRNEIWGYSSNCKYAEAFVPLKLML
jgi:LmbE family N-acetylglucosaminyl deacetylase